MSRAQSQSQVSTVFGCALPPGWASVNGISVSQTAFADSVRQLPIDKRDHCLELEALTGNDPEINVDQYNEIGGDDFVFVGTSFLRSLLLCLQIATDRADPNIMFPRLIIIDRNHFIISCWNALRENLIEIINGDFRCINSVVMSHLEQYRDKNPQLLALTDLQITQCVAAEIAKFLPRITIFNHDLIQAVVNHAIIICADWSNTEIFQNINIFCDENGIRKRILYPSNIVECAFQNPADQRIILENTQLLSPTLSIHTVANFTATDIKKGAYFQKPSAYFCVKKSVLPTEVLNHIRRFSVTRAHESAMPLPEKMQVKDAVLLSTQAPVQSALLTHTFLDRRHLSETNDGTSTPTVRIASKARGSRPNNVTDRFNLDIEHMSSTEIHDQFRKI